MTSDKVDYNFMKDRVMDEVKRLFKPEFLNRIDEINRVPSADQGHISMELPISCLGPLKRGKAAGD